MSISPDGIIGTSFHKGKTQKYTITLDRDVDHIYFKTSTFGQNVYASYNPIEGKNSERINLNQLEVIEDNDHYKLLYRDNFFTGLHYILVNKKSLNTNNEFSIHNISYSVLTINRGFLSGDYHFIIKN